MNTWGMRGTLAAVGVAVVVAGVGGAGIYAATGSTGRTEGWHGRPGSAEPPPDEVHAESVVTHGDGFRTELTQTGVVTAIDSVSMTARSADGFTATYVIPPEVTTPHPAAGDGVTIEASAAAGKPPTVTTIRLHRDQ